MLYLVVVNFKRLTESFSTSKEAYAFARAWGKLNPKDIVTVENVQTKGDTK